MSLCDIIYRLYRIVGNESLVSDSLLMTYAKVMSYSAV